MQLLNEVLDFEEIALFLTLEEKFEYMMEVFVDLRQVMQDLDEYGEARNRIESI
jgi:hypothetical protein